MTTYTKKQIDDKAKSLVVDNVIRSIAFLIEYVNEHTPDLIPELVSDAYNAREINQDDMFAYLLLEHNEDLVELLDVWYTDEDNELEGKELLQAYHEDPDVVSSEIEELYREKNEEDQPEILQYVLINSYATSLLREQGEIVIELMDLDVWCRCTYGQMFYLDQCWQQAAQDLLEAYGLDD